MQIKIEIKTKNQIEGEK